MFQGYIDEGSAGNIIFQLRDAIGAPVEPDAAPTFRVYGQNGPVANGSGTATVFESGSITGATNASPIVITSANHGVTTGQAVHIAGVGGNTNANGNFIATKIDANTFSLNGSSGNGAYTSGGTWNTQGLYRCLLNLAILSALTAGKTFVVLMNWVTGGADRVERASFTVR